MNKLSTLLRIIGIVLVIALLGIGTSNRLAQASQPVDLLTTTAPQMKKVLDYPANQPLDSSNNDCTNSTYRLAGDTTMQSGCFVSTTHGLVQNGGPALFNGTDEATPLDGKNYGLAPVPNQPLLMAVSGADTFGANLQFYHYSDLKDEYVTAGLRLVHYLTPEGPPSLTLKDNRGQAVVANYNTTTFSSNGDWLVTESPRHALIRVNLATMQITPFTAPFNTQPWDYALPLHPMAISDDGRYVAVQGGTPLAFKTYDLATCQGNTVDELAPLSCAAHDYWPLITQTVPHITGEYGLVHVRFVNDTTLSFNLKFNDVAATDTSLEQWQSAAYILSADGSKSALEYLALGDSYTSGEGTFNYVTGTDTATNMCHLSLHAYPYLVSLPIFNQGHSVACSGATIHDIDNLSSGYYGQTSDGIARKNRANVSSILAGFSPGYLAQMEFVKAYQPNIITVSTAGNDIGYADILQQCAEPHLLHNTCYGTYEDKAEVYTAIDRKYRELLALYTRLKAAAPVAQIYAVGYPQVAATGGDCALNVRLNYDEITFTQNVVNYLNKTIETAALNTGIPYVDISQALAGHRLCETKSFNVAMNGLTSGKDSGIFGINFIGKESFHPSAFGQQLIANTILAKTHNFAAAQPQTPANKPPPNGLQNPDLATALKTNRVIKQLVRDNTITSGNAQKKKITTVKVKGADSGLKPRSSFAISLDRGAIALSQATTDSDGSIETTATIPDSTPAGTHTLDVTGSSLTDQPVDVSGSIYITDIDTDYDGDGVPNTSDSCLAVINSGIDADNDGVDDACDPFIGQAPATPSTPTPPIAPNTEGPRDDTNQSNSPNPPLQPASPSFTSSAPNIKQLAAATSSQPNQTLVENVYHIRPPLSIGLVSATNPLKIQTQKPSKLGYSKQENGARRPLPWQWSTITRPTLIRFSLWLLLLLPLLYALIKSKCSVPKMT